ncbi:hypothetical protein NOJ28_21195 [Neorhizobium galegae]|uniref:hypothetical protein n=1 Tax=Neorhizobium galegae TaxID=399 RepID=UPI0021052F66|nr:hypothetical protein [Neorhizobium galegae]MCQ1768062.1 hypothetical protein [Neorhizobium galegae]MCQ1848570.1 hypothetical protein [Neorhizobium galegae]
MASQFRIPADQPDHATAKSKTLRALLKKHAKTMFELADIYSALSMKDADGTALLKSAGVTEEQFGFFKKLKKLDLETRKLVIEHGVSTSVVEALVETDEVTRERLALYLQQYHKLELADVREIEAQEQHTASPLQAIHNLLKPEIELIFSRQADNFRMELESKAKALYAVLHDYDTLGVEAKAARKLEIVRAAAETKACFETIFHDAERPVGKWLFVGRESRLKRALAEASHALTELAAGRFENRLPEIRPICFKFLLPGTMEHLPTWKAIDSIAFLTGNPSLHYSQKRLSPFHGKKLNAINLLGGIGGHALGIASANYVLLGVFETDPASVETLRSNAPLCNIIELDVLSDRKNVIDAINDLLSEDTVSNGKLDLLSAALITSQRRDEHPAVSHDEFLKAMFHVVSKVKPRSFFFEMNLKIREEQKTSLILGYRNLGYHVQFCSPSFQDYGSLQRNADKYEPGRIYMIGIGEAESSQLRLPIARLDRNQTVGEVIGTEDAVPSQLRLRNARLNRHQKVGEVIKYVAFPEATRRTFRVPRLSPPLPPDVQLKYDNRAKEILGRDDTDIEPTCFQEITNLPDPAFGLNEYKRVTETAPVQAVKKVGRPKKYVTELLLSVAMPVKQRWAAAGFDVGLRLTDHQMNNAIIPGEVQTDAESEKVTPVFTDGRLPLTPNILKAIRGMPLPWRVAGDLTQQIELLCEASPPVVALAISHSLHAALTGSPMNVKFPRALFLQTPGCEGFGSVPRIENVDDGEAWVAALWERGIATIGEEPDWSHFDEDADDDGETVDFIIDNCIMEDFDPGFYPIVARD